MYEYTDWIKSHSNLAIYNIFEIGANLAQDAEVLAKEFSVDSKNVFVFEAHPVLAKRIKELHKFNCYNNAVFNEDKIINFNMCDPFGNNTGVSTLMNDESRIFKNKTEVEAIRMDKFLIKNKIDFVDFLKIDVEGATYEVLEGFGDKLTAIKCVQLEAEHNLNYTGQHSFEDIYKLLTENDFSLCLFERKKAQSDSLWLKNEYIEKSYWEREKKKRVC